MLILRIIPLIVWLLSSSAHAAGPAIGDSLQHIVSGPIYMLRDEQQSIEFDQFVEYLRNGRIDTRIDTPINLGAVTTRVWLGFAVHNKSDAAQTLQLETGAAFRPVLNVDLIGQDGRVERLLTESHAVPFAERNGLSRYLTSVPFELPAQSAAWLTLEYQTIGFSLLPLRIDSPDQVLARQIKDDRLTAWFYAFSLAALLLFGLFGFAMSDWIIIRYALLFLLGLFNISTMEGVAFQLIWPTLPGWNHYAPLLTAYVLVAFGFWVARSAVAEELMPGWLNRVLGSLVIVSLLLIPLIFFADFVWMSVLVSWLLIAMFLAHVFSMSHWVTLNQTPNRVALVSAIIVLVVLLGLTLMAQNPGLLPAWVYLYINRLVFLFIMLATITLLSSHVRSLQRNHERALQEALQAAEREAKINRALYEAEQNYVRAQKLASLRREQLATASHDMKQPLVSLRSAMDALMHDQPVATREQLRNAFNYLDNLCNHYLSETRPDAAESRDENPSVEARLPTNDSNTTEAPYPVGLIIDTAQRMFADEAAARGIQLRAVACTALISLTPMVIMRIYTNLVSNAVKHCEKGRIILGARRRTGKVQLQVIDSGPGMSPQQLASVMQAYQKGPDSQGSGLGLAICRQLAEEHGLGFEIDSTPGVGTRCCLTIPSVEH